MAMTAFDGFLSFLFKQYKTEFKPRFGSRFSAYYARLLVGTAAARGLDVVRQDLRNTYFNLMSDRRPPREEAALKEWNQDSRLVTTTRTYDERYIGKGSSVLTFTICLALCAGAWGVHSIKNKFKDSSDDTVATAPAEQVQANAGRVSGDLSKAQCEELLSFITTGRVDAGLRKTQDQLDRCKANNHF